MKNMKHTLFLLAGFFISFTLTAQTAHEMKVDVKKPVCAIQPTMYGIFYEDINFAGDGGLYAELVKNRSFEFPDPFMGWQIAGNVKLRDDGPFERNPHYVRLGYSGHHEKYTALINEGFFGIGIKEKADYRFTVWARAPKGTQGGKIRVELAQPATMAESQVLTQKELTIISPDWKQYELILTSPVTDPKAVLRIFLLGAGDVDLEHVSLFPVDTWKGHRNGLRKDLAQALYDLHPGIMRFPGGCIVEGTDLATRFNWKNSVGAVENRPLNENRWHYTFPHRFFPDYFQSYGLGFFEFFQLCEEIGAEPLPVVSCGLACQFQNDDPKAHAPLDSLQPFVQDALDLIEFANGDTTTTWGGLRAKMGHPAPFNMKFLAVGNEQWGELYTQRAPAFIKALREKHPEIKIIGTAGPYSGGDMFNYLWPKMREFKVDLVDEHFYAPESFFLKNADRYDNYPRTGPKVFAGEYACHGANGKKWNHFNASLLESGFMTGLERNADVVYMATYAPLFSHIEGWQWRPDLIWYDNLRSVRSCSYYVQQLYSLYKGTHLLRLTMNGAPVKNSDGQDGLYASAVWDKNKSEVVVKVINVSETAQPFTLAFDGLKKKEMLAGEKCILFHSDDLLADNTLDNQQAIVPQEVAIDAAALDNGAHTFKASIAAKTFAVYIFTKK